jgi:hypothetical protein
MNDKEPIPPEQLFQLEHLGDGWYRIKNELRVLDILPSPVTLFFGKNKGVNRNDAPVLFSEQEDDKEAQRFRIVNAGDGLYQIWTYYHRNLQLRNGSTANGTNVVTFTPSPSFNDHIQNWRIYPVNDQGKLTIWDEFVRGGSVHGDGTGVYVFGGHQYQVLNQQMTWEEAKREAEGRGGYLATITSAEEEAFVFNLTKQGNLDAYWLGGQADSNRVWTWITGERFTYTNWGRGQPDADTRGSEQQDKVTIRPDSRYGDPGQWDDNWSTNRIGFVIEWGKANSGGILGAIGNFFGGLFGGGNN